MIEHLAVLLNAFPGAPNQTRCFTHILNLVAKSVLRQFEGPKKEKVAQALAGVIDEINGDNDETFDSGTNEGGDECDDVDDELIDDDDGELPDELDELSEEEVLSVKESVKPIRLILTKVSVFSTNINIIQQINNGFTALRSIQHYQKFINHCPA